LFYPEGRYAASDVESWVALSLRFPVLIKHSEPFNKMIVRRTP